MNSFKDTSNTPSLFLPLKGEGCRRVNEHLGVYPKLGGGVRFQQKGNICT